MNRTRTAAILAAIAGGPYLAGCVMGPFPGVPERLPANTYVRGGPPAGCNPELRGRPEWVPLPDETCRKREAAPPRVLYRIDENRYFEDASDAGHFCENGSPIYYVDKARGIRSYVVKMDGASMGAAFIIDAANDQYLIGPATRGNTDCSSGGGACGGSRLPYSTDGGRTWKRADALSSSAPMSIAGDHAYSIDSFDLTNSLDLGAVSLPRRSWTVVSRSGQLPPSRKPPIDNIFRCNVNGKE